MTGSSSPGANRSAWRDQVAIVSDVLPILAAGTPDCCGVALIAGTGSSALAAPPMACQTLRRLGLSPGRRRQRLCHRPRRLATRIAESGSRTPEPDLAEAVARKLDVKSVTELTRAVYGDSDPTARHRRVRTASLQRGRGWRRRSVQNSGCRGSRTGRPCCPHGRLRSALTDSGFPLAVSGGVLINSPRLQNQIASGTTRPRPQLRSDMWSANRSSVASVSPIQNSPTSW